MATNDEELKALDLENAGAEQEQEDLKRAAQTDKVVRGVNGSVVPRRASCVRWLASSSSQLSSWRRCTCDTAWQTAIRRPQSRLKPPKLASVPQRLSRRVSSPTRHETDSTPAKCTCRTLSLRAHPSEHGWRKRTWRPRSWIGQWNSGKLRAAD